MTSLKKEPPSLASTLALEQELTSIQQTHLTNLLVFLEKISAQTHSPSYNSTHAELRCLYQKVRDEIAAGLEKKDHHKNITLLRIIK